MTHFKLCWNSLNAILSPDPVCGISNTDFNFKCVTTKGSPKSLFNYFSADVCVCVFVCVRVCISVHRKDFSWLSRTMDVLPDIQASDVVLRKLFRVKNLCLHIIDNHSRDLLASNCARVSIKPGRAARSERQLLKLSKTNGKIAKHSYLPPQ